MDYSKLYINGEWVASTGSQQLEVINPATEQAVTQIALGTETDVDRAVQAATTAFETFGSSSVAFRLYLLENIGRELQISFGEMSDLITQEMGAPYRFCRDEQTESGVGHLMEIIDVLKQYNFSTQKGSSRVVMEPIGVCGLITPWNWPLNQICCKVFPALAAGCTMVLKPSEVAPLSAMLFADILHRAGVPAGVFNLVNGDGETVGNAISTHPDIHMVSITGSTRAGIAVAKNAAETVKRVHQELGGNSPNIILDDADLDTAVALGVRSVFSNSGQTCDSPARMLVPHAKMARALEVARGVAESLVIGDTSDEKTELGPLVSQTHFDKVQSLIQLAIDENATVAAGGVGRPDHLPVGYYCKPTVLGVTQDMQIAMLEIFGPVVQIMGYGTEEEAIAIANRVEYGLAAYIQTADKDKARRIAKRLRAGTVQINYPDYDNRVPFGGYKQSGNGREYAEYGLHDFMEYKSIIGYD